MTSSDSPSIPESSFNYRELDVLDIKVELQRQGDDLYIQSSTALPEFDFRMTSNLEKWAEAFPDKIFLGEKVNGIWQTITYGEAYRRTLSIATWLINILQSFHTPIAIVANNSISNGLLSLACLHIGIPYSPINPAYINKNKEYTKIKHVLHLLNPQLLIVDEYPDVELVNELDATTTIVTLKSHSSTDKKCISLNAILETVTDTDSVSKAHSSIQPDTIAKILFTSGSTGMPKGVMNTHLNITTNWAQITTVFPMMKNGFTLLDWLPWNHTFGSNHNFGLTLYTGSTLYLDDGNATPEGILCTVQNLKFIQPDIYFNVPKGYDLLIKILEANIILRDLFYKNLKLIFYAGAGMSQSTWYALESLAISSIGKKVLISTGLGCTESSPSALFNTKFNSKPGNLGLPVPGLVLKLAAVGDKYEARFRGGNVFPGYWNNVDATINAFDEEGFYKTGDALKFNESVDINSGFIFDGRITEDFKLNTGTWVSVGPLRAHIIDRSEGLIQDVVITGHDRDCLGALLFLDKNKSNPEFNHLRIEDVIQKVNAKSIGSSTFIKIYRIADFDLSAEMGEITEKGSVNQRKVLDNRKALIESMYENRR